MALIEGARTAVIARGDAAPIFQPAKQALNEIAALVKLDVADGVELGVEPALGASEAA